MSDDIVISYEEDDDEDLLDAGRISIGGSEIGVGEVLDGIYELKGVLGEGGMGKIFAAQDLLLKRRVAVKVPLTPEALEVLIAEAKALAALRHPHLPVVHAAGKHGSLDYLVMEQLSGVDLDKRISERVGAGRSLSLREALDLLSTITDALQAIHQAGIAHRDIKPENVLICKRGPVLIDFGLVAAASSDEAIDGGSPCYVPPELIQRTSRRSTRHLSDIYSLGVLAYELFTGHVPFDAEELMDLLKLHVEAPVPDVRGRRPDAPAALATLITEMMDKEPTVRPSAQEVKFRLSSIIKSLEDHPEPPTALVVSEDMGFCGQLARKIEAWSPQATVRVGRSLEKATKVLDEVKPRIMIVDNSGASGVELLMGLRSSESQPAGIVALTKDFHTVDRAMLRRMAVFCMIERGQLMDDELRLVTCNVLNAGPAR
jgi:serine/threonine protein kinase